MVEWAERENFKGKNFVSNVNKDETKAAGKFKQFPDYFNDPNKNSLEAFINCFIINFYGPKRCATFTSHNYWHFYNFHAVNFN